MVPKNFKILSETKVEPSGTLKHIEHYSTSTNSMMKFNIYIPKGPGPFPVLYVLAGRQCTQNTLSKPNLFARTAS